MRSTIREELEAYLMIGAFAAVGALGYWVGPMLLDSPKAHPQTAPADDKAAVSSLSLAAPFVLLVDDQGNAWRAINDRWVTSEYTLSHYANTHEIEYVKQVDGKTLYRICTMKPIDRKRSLR